METGERRTQSLADSIEYSTKYIGETVNKAGEVRVKYGIGERKK